MKRAEEKQCVREMKIIAADFPLSWSENCWCSLSGVPTSQTAVSSPLMPYNGFKCFSTPWTNQHTPHWLHTSNNRPLSLSTYRTVDSLQAEITQMTSLWCHQGYFLLFLSCPQAAMWTWFWEVSFYGAVSTYAAFLPLYRLSEGQQFDPQHLQSTCTKYWTPNRSQCCIIGVWV